MAGPPVASSSPPVGIVGRRKDRAGKYVFTTRSRRSGPGLRSAIAAACLCHCDHLGDLSHGRARAGRRRRHQPEHDRGDRPAGRSATVERPYRPRSRRGVSAGLSGFGQVSPPPPAGDRHRPWPVVRQPARRHRRSSDRYRCLPDRRRFRTHAGLSRERRSGRHRRPVVRPRRAGLGGPDLGRYDAVGGG